MIRAKPTEKPFHVLTLPPVMNVDCGKLRWSAQSIDTETRKRKPYPVRPDCRSRQYTPRHGSVHQRDDQQNQRRALHARYDRCADRKSGSGLRWQADVSIPLFLPRHLFHGHRYQASGAL